MTASKIEWTDRSDWNYLRGCTRVSEGCHHCYAEAIAARFSGPGQPFHGFAERTKNGPRWTGKVAAIPERLTLPLRWRKPARIFVNSAFDLFHEDVADDEIDRVFAVMALAPQHTFQLLTKRAQRMRVYLSALSKNADRDRANELPAYWQSRLANANQPGSLPISKNDVERALGFCAKFTYDQPTPAWPLPNVHLGVSVEDQATADARVPELLATPAALRFVSAEPLLGPIDFTRLGTLEVLRSALPQVAAYHEADVRPNTISGMQIEALGRPGQATTFYQTPDHMGGFAIRFPRPFPRLDWIIVGGESGANARTMHPDWPRAIRDQCANAVVPFFFKQWGEWIGADQWLREIQADGSRLTVCGRALQTPLNFHDAQAVAEMSGAPFQHQSDGSTLLRVGRRRAGRLLDGREHNDLPEIRS